VTNNVCDTLTSIHPSRSLLWARYELRGSKGENDYKCRDIFNVFLSTAGLFTSYILRLNSWTVKFKSQSTSLISFLHHTYTNMYFSKFIIFAVALLVAPVALGRPAPASEDDSIMERRAMPTLVTECIRVRMPSPSMRTFHLLYSLYFHCYRLSCSTKSIPVAVALHTFSNRELEVPEPSNKTLTSSSEIMAYIISSFRIATVFLDTSYSTFPRIAGSSPSHIRNSQELKTAILVATWSIQHFFTNTYMTSP
jgi:hypothetical protein